MEERKITWRINGIFKADAEKVYNEIQTLGNRYSTQEIVNLARDPNTELHNCFEWDDSVAAEKYRLEQAKTIVRQLSVTVKKEERESVSYRLIVSTGDRDNTYQSMKFVIRDPDEYQRLLAQAKEDARIFRNKYKSLKEFDEVFEAIDELL